MKVIDHQPQAWFLLDDAGALYLDAQCSHSAFDCTVLIALNPAETAAFASKGRRYIDKLAYDIHYSAPAVIGSKSPYKSRNLTVLNGPEHHAADRAIDAWIAANPLP